MLTRSGDGWAFPDQRQFRAVAMRLFPDAVDVRPKSTRKSARCRFRCSTSSGPILILPAPPPAGRLCLEERSSGNLDLKIHGLSRAGLVLASNPVDVAVAAIVNGNQAGLRAVAASGGGDCRPSPGAVRAARERPAWQN